MQVQQAAINLLKNAEESGSAPDEVSVDVESDAAGSRLCIADRGKGMTDEVLRNALLPFYSTKPLGSGLGLPLCREIFEAHGGRLRVQSRDGGGTVVVCELPPAEARSPKSTARLTLTRH